MIGEHTMFFIYRQSNTGGELIRNQEVDDYVIIEASRAVFADAVAEESGLYFGELRLPDCPCCGERWSRQFGDSWGHRLLEEALVWVDLERTFIIFDTGARVRPAQLDLYLPR
jgi:hypothetical protein